MSAHPIISHRSSLALQRRMTQNEKQFQARNRPHMSASAITSWGNLDMPMPRTIANTPPSLSHGQVLNSGQAMHPRLELTRPTCVQMRETIEAGGRDSRWEFSKAMLFEKSSHAASVASDLAACVTQAATYRRFLSTRLRIVTGNPRVRGTPHPLISLDEGIGKSWTRLMADECLALGVELVACFTQHSHLVLCLTWSHVFWSHVFCASPGPMCADDRRGPGPCAHPASLHSAVHQPCELICSHVCRRQMRSWPVCTNREPAQRSTSAM